MLANLCLVVLHGSGSEDSVIDFYYYILYPRSIYMLNDAHSTHA